MKKQDFYEKVIDRLQSSQNDILELRKLLVEYKEMGVEQTEMLENLTLLCNMIEDDKKDYILDLMDFVTGFCNHNLKIY